jgi:hypothetical protein
VLQLLSKNYQRAALAAFSNGANGCKSKVDPMRTPPRPYKMNGEGGDTSKTGATPSKNVPNVEQPAGEPGIATSGGKFEGNGHAAVGKVMRTS